MTVTIELSDEQAAALQAQAAAEGLSVDALVARLAENYVESTCPESKGNLARPVWQIVTDRMKNVPPDVFDRLPRDGASEHDHYLYGSPKRNE